VVFFIHYSEATFLEKKSLNFLEVSILSIILKIIALSSVSSSEIKRNCSCACLSSITTSLGKPSLRLITWSTVISTAGFYANKDKNGNYSGGGTLALGFSQDLNTLAHESFHAYSI